MKIISNLFKAMTAIMAFCISEQALTSAQGAASADAYIDMRYSTAFDQEAIYKKHKSLLESLGCANNVFTSKSKDVAPMQEEADLNDIEMNSSVTIDIADEDQALLASDNSITNSSSELTKFQQDCLKPLKKARFMALAEPGIYELLEISLIAGSAVATRELAGPDSMGGSFAVFSGAINAFLSLPKIVKTGYQLAVRPDNCLANLEEYYAKNKCYIPNLLWEKIEDAFVQARQNQFAREKNINFLRIALSFTMYKPKPATKFKCNWSADAVKDELNQRINNFFKDYQIKDGGQSIQYIKINVAKFIDSLLDKKNNRASAPRYLYLHGLGGIGKTHFVQTLAQWIDELVPQSVNFEDLVISSAVELEGNLEMPGAFLKVLQKQLTQQKRGSVIIIDEATWINQDDMISSAKRMFNGDRSKLSTAYFGTDMHGAAVTLDVPPMLIFVASNDMINDPALASRFDIVDYPTPNKAALIEHAIKTARKSKALAREKYTINEAAISKITTLAEKLDPKNCNFRYVAGNIEAYLLTQTAEPEIVPEQREEAQQ